MKVAAMEDRSHEERSCFVGRQLGYLTWESNLAEQMQS